MLGIRLQRTGRRNAAAYRIVVAERSSPIKGRFLEIVGYYLPRRKPSVLEFNQERIEYWISNGARPTDTVARLLKKNDMKDMDKFISTYTKKKKRKAVEEEEAASPPPAAEEAPAEAPAEESPKEETTSEDVEEVEEVQEVEEQVKEEPGSDANKKEESSESSTSS